MLRQARDWKRFEQRTHRTREARALAGTGVAAGGDPDEAEQSPAILAGRALFFVLSGIFWLPGIASALVALGVALALTTGARLVRSLVVAVSRAMRSGDRAASGAAPPLDEAPQVALVGEAEIEGGLG